MWHIHQIIWKDLSLFTKIILIGIDLIVFSISIIYWYVTINYCKKHSIRKYLKDIGY